MSHHRQPWSADDDARLRELYPCTPTRELPGLIGRTRMAVKVRAAALHLRKNPDVSMRPQWHPDEDAVLRLLYPDTPTDAIAAVLARPLASTYQRARKLGLRKDAAYLESPAAGRLRPGDGRGTASRFRPGQVPANKGVKRGKGWAPGRMREGQFKRGEMRGAAQRNYKRIGAERISKDGYLERKIRDIDPAGLSPAEANRQRARCWRAVHLLVWEAEHGPLPPGHAVVFRNGDRRNIRLENLECITRQELMARNTVHNLPAPLPQTLQLLGALNRKINRRRQAEATA